jgi:NAD dependent epimerase/dehydratase family enzyme
MGKSVWLPNVPAFVLRAVLGEMSTIVLSSQLVSNKKIESTGYTFKYTQLSKALEDLL